MRASPQAPAYTPTFEATKVRGLTKQYRGNSNLGGLPVFSWPGRVNFTDISPVWIMLAPRDFRGIWVVQADGQSTLTFDVLVNEIAVLNIVSVAVYQDVHDIDDLGGLSVALNDTVRLSLTGYGSGLGENITVSFF